MATLKLRKLRRVKKEKTKYLVQEREGMDDVIYVYTEALAKRPDMHSITEDEAKGFLAEQYPDLFEIEETGEVVTVQEPVVDVEETGAGVIADLEGAVQEPEEEDFIQVPEPVVPKTDPKVAAGIDRDTDPECMLIDSFTKKNQVEHYLLATHGLEIETKDQKLVDLKEEAISAVIAKRL
jgi:hypothetical protein